MHPLLIPLWPDAADLLGVGRTTIRRLAATGELPTVRIGRRRLVHIDDLIAYVEGLKTQRNETVS